MSNQYCTFRLDGHLFGVPVGTVQEVLRQQQLTRVPLAPPEVSGLINLRGQIVVTVDLRKRMGLPPRAASAGGTGGEGSDGADGVPVGTNIVVRTSDGPTALQADEIGDVLEPDPDRFEAPPSTVPARVRKLVTAVCKLDHELMLVLDTEKAAAAEHWAA